MLRDTCRILPKLAAPVVVREVARLGAARRQRFDLVRALVDGRAARHQACREAPPDLRNPGDFDIW